MKKLCIMLLALGCGTQLFAQDANPLIENVLMLPNPIKVGQTGYLTAEVRNVGKTSITAGCALVSIDVPSSISGKTLTINTLLSDPIWAFKNYGLSGNIVLINSGGILPGGAVNRPIVLNVSGDAKGGPSTIQAVISLNMGCTGLGKMKVLTADQLQPTTITMTVKE